MDKGRILSAALAGALLTAGGAASAADWSDTSLGYRYGTNFHEPFDLPAGVGPVRNVKKNIYMLTHASGYKYGTNFFNVDLLESDNNDPAANGRGAQEVYVVYRNTVDIGKVIGKDLKWGIMRGYGVTFGFDWNTKNDAGYSSKKRMAVLGPTVMFDTPGFFNLSLLVLKESNDPTGNPTGGRYTYKTHPMLTGAWGIPISDWPLSFEGFFNVIAPKGRDEFGASTKTETNFDGQIMLDVGRVVGGPKGTFKLGLEYQYWKNKFGNDASGPAGGGAIAKTPMIRAEYHF